MRIWILTSELPHEFAGGIARYVDNFSRLLGKAGHEVVVISRTEDACDKIISPGVRLIGFSPRYGRLSDLNPQGAPDLHPAYPYNVLSYGPALSYQAAEEVLQLLQRLPSPDVIESQEYAALPYFLLQRKLTERTPLETVPILVHLHSPSFELAYPNQEPRYRFPEYWVGQMEKFSIVAADVLLSPSQYLTRRIQSTLNRPLDIATIPHPVLISREFSPHLAQRRQLVCVGRLQMLKGTLHLVKACSRLWSAGEDFQLTLVGGDADFFPKATTVGAFIQQRYAKWIHSGHLRLTGQLDHAVVLDHMQRAWVVVIPSLIENFPNTCIEAMSVGQVVLASRSGGQSEMIDADGRNGFLFDWEIPGDFEQKLRAILTLSEAQRNEVAQQAQRRIRSFCEAEDILTQRLKHYKEIIENQSPRRVFPAINQIHPASPVSVRAENEQSGLLSVIIPYYNLGKYLPEALESVLASTYPSLEVLIVNDGSTDEDSLDVLRQIERRELSQVRILHTENQGLALTRNTGAEAAQGEFLAFVDADDAVETSFFQLAINVLRQYENVAVVYPWLRYFEGSSDIWPTWNTEFPYLLAHNTVAVLAVMRRSAFLRWARNTPEAEYNLEDYEGWIGLVEAGAIGVSLPHPLARYRIRTGSLWQNTNRHQLLYMYDVITRRHPEVYREWGVELFHLQNANGPSFSWNHPARATVEPPAAYLAALEQEKNKLATDVQTLGKAWEDQSQFIASQRAYIESLEARFHELLEKMQTDGVLSRSTTNGIPWHDYELGGRLVNRMRRTWVMKQMLRAPWLKGAIKKMLGE
jgi:glycosyltransferase involved in cell wall biosynthesis